jgi:hypothetical protein
MKLVELGARFMDFVDLEFLELRCLAGKKWSGAVFLNLEQFGALPNTPLIRHSGSKCEVGDEEPLQSKLHLLISRDNAVHVAPQCLPAF